MEFWFVFMFLIPLAYFVVGLLVSFVGALIHGLIVAGRWTLEKLR